MAFNLGGALAGVADPQGMNERLVDRLTAQRQKDLQWRQMQSNLFEDMVRAGHFPGITQDEIDQRLQEIWGDHKGNKKHLQDMSEQVHGVRGIFDKLGHLLGVPSQPQPVNASAQRTPFGKVTTPGATTDLPNQTDIGSAAPAGSLAPPPVGSTGTDMITVQIPGMPSGQIHSSRWDEFKQRYPNAMRTDMGIGQSVQ